MPGESIGHSLCFVFSNKVLSRGSSKVSIGIWLPYMMIQNAILKLELRIQNKRPFGKMNSFMVIIIKELQEKKLTAISPPRRENSRLVMINLPLKKISKK